MNGRTIVAWNIRRIRVAKELSQERLAGDAEVDRAYLGGLERSQENPTIDLLDRVARALDVPLGTLFIQPARGTKRPAPLKAGRRPAG